MVDSRGQQSGKLTDVFGPVSEEDITRAPLRVTLRFVILTTLLSAY